MNLKKTLFLAAVAVTALSSCSGNVKADYAKGLKETEGLSIVHMSELTDDDLKFAKGNEKFAGYMTAKDYYVVNGMGTCTDTMIVIPEYYDDGTHGRLPVAAVKDWARLAVNTVIAHNTLESLGQLGLRGCKRFIGNGVKIIGDGCMGGLADDYVVMPQGLIHADQWAWFFTTGPTKIWLPKTLKSLGNAVFMDSTYNTINFEGTEAQWNAIELAAGSWEYPDMTINFNVKYPGLQCPIEEYIPEVVPPTSEGGTSEAA